MSVNGEIGLLKVNIKNTEKGIVVNSLETATKDKSILLNDNKTAILDLKEDAQIKFTIIQNPGDFINVNAITFLNLTNCNLEYLPDWIGELPLVKLNLSRNKILEVPYCIYEGLKFLECLDLSNNNLKEFDYPPKCVVRLRTLNLSNNFLINIPSWILQVKCFNLEELYFNNNDVTTFKSSKFYCKSAYRLKVLEVKNSCVRCEDVNFFKHIRSLNSLDLGNDFLMHVKYNCFANSESFVNLFNKPRWDDSLKVLKLTNLGIAYIPDEIKNIVNLEEFYLSNNKLGLLPEGINCLEKLLVLDVSCNQICSLSLSVATLKILKAAYNDISEINLNGVELDSLDLYCNFMLDFNVELSLTKSLQELDLEQNCFDTDVVDVSNYYKLKVSLRLKTESRVDGIREDKYFESDSSDSDSNYSVCHTDGGKEGAFNSEEEELWELNDSYELPKNGCTASDNEWTGVVKLDVKSKKKKNLERTPSWLFEDAF